MSLFGSLGTRYQKQCETSENHSDSDLKTHYYKENFNVLFQSVEEIYQNHTNLGTIHSSKEHGEIAVELHKEKQLFLIITIVSLRPFETAVDLNVSTEQGSLTGVYPFLKDEVLRLYEILDKKHTYVGTGKNAY